MKKIMFNDQYGLTKAVIEGRKTQTRRIAIHSGEDAQVLEDINLKDSDKAIIKYIIDKYSCFKNNETVAVAQSYQNLWETDPEALAVTEASQVKEYYAKNYPGYTVEQINRSAGWRNKMFVKADLMPHRIRITNIRLERLQDISDADCLKEGIRPWDESEETSPRVKQSIAEIKATGITPYQIPGHWDCYSSPREAFASLIDKVSGKGTWNKNPWVFVYDFELLK